MRVLFATAMACVAVAACGQADPLPPGMASRITSPAAVFSVAVPTGWQDLGMRNPQEASGPTGAHSFSIGPGAGVPFRTNPPGILSNPPAGWKLPALVVRWSDPLPFGSGVTDHYDTPPVTIAGETVRTYSDGDYSLFANFEHQVVGRTELFFVSCPYEVARATCTDVLSSWRWESGSETSSRNAVALLVGVLSAAAVVVAGIAFFTVNRTRRRRRPAEL